MIETDAMLLSKLIAYVKGCTPFTPKTIILPHVDA